MEIRPDPAGNPCLATRGAVRTTRASGLSLSGFPRGTLNQAVPCSGLAFQPVAGMCIFTVLICWFPSSASTQLVHLG
jgi:hypothetical protein